MDKLVPEAYREYGMYVNHFRAFPLDLDGLKPVERRILLSSYNVCRDKFVKSAKVDGENLAHFHPHSSCYSTIVQLVHKGFLDGQGNFGVAKGIDSCPAAAERYTEVRLNKFIKDSVFELIDYVPFEESELDPEPPFLPTRYPLCLLGGEEYTVGIGFAYRTLIPAYSLEDLRKRLMFLLGKEKKEPIIRPISDCEILAEEKDLKQLLTTGKATIAIKGKYKTDANNCKITVNSWPPGKRFESILSKFSKELEAQEIGWRDHSASNVEVVFTVTRQRNRDDLFQKLIAKMDEILTGSISFETIVVDKDKNVKLISIDDMLLTTFKMYKDVNLKMLSSEISKIKNQIISYKALSKIKPYLAKYLKVGIEQDEAIKKISEESKVDENLIKDLFSRYKINKLLSCKDDIQELENEEKILKEKLSSLDEFVISKY
jgi:DNA gyrase/topoisomerase IV subunit A